MSDVDFGERCRCSCHHDLHTVHCVPCCVTCDICGEHVNFGYMERHKECYHPMNRIEKFFGEDGDQSAPESADQVDAILDNFDFHEVSRTFDAMGYDLASGGHDPAELRRIGRSLLQHLVDHPDLDATSTSRLEAQRHGGYLSLAFVPVSVSASEIIP